MNFIFIFTFTGILAMVSIKAAPSPSSESGKNNDEEFDQAFYEAKSEADTTSKPYGQTEDHSHGLMKRQMDFAMAPQMMMGMAMQAKDNIMGSMQNGSNPMEAMANEASSMAEMASSLMGSMGA